MFVSFSGVLSNSKMAQHQLRLHCSAWIQSKGRGTKSNHQECVSDNASKTVVRLYPACTETAGCLLLVITLWDMTRVPPIGLWSKTQFPLIYLLNFFLYLQTVWRKDELICLPVKQIWLILNCTPYSTPLLTHLAAQPQFLGWRACSQSAWIWRQSWVR